MCHSPARRPRAPKARYARSHFHNEIWATPSALAAELIPTPPPIKMSAVSQRETRLSSSERRTHFIKSASGFCARRASGNRKGRLGPAKDWRPPRGARAGRKSARCSRADRRPRARERFAETRSKSKKGGPMGRAPDRLAGRKRRALPRASRVTEERP